MDERRRAIKRGLEFIYGIACTPEHFAEHGSDLVSCFNFISATSKDPWLRRTARRMGRERARQWRRENPSLPEDADADTILFFVHGSLSADNLGVRDAAVKKQVQEAAKRFKPRDYFYFDPNAEAPPSDVPHQCDHCDEWNARGRKMCRECRKRLEMQSPYLVWYMALVATYTCARYGVWLGAGFEDMLRWLPYMRPYSDGDYHADPDFYDSVYAATHVVYTLNDYSLYQLSPRWLAPEYKFLKSSLKKAMGAGDADMVGELLDTMKAFGLPETHPLMRKGMDYLLSCQNADGSWGDADDGYIYGRYHPTWTAIDGLREYAWRGTRLSFPEVKPLLSARRKRQPRGAK